MPTLANIVQRLEALAPLHLAESWDQPGLQVGNRTWPVTRGLLCIDLTQAVLEEAVALKANLIVAYHPLLFKPLTRLTSDEEKSALALEAAGRRIAIYSPHTALDAAEGGVNDWFADLLGPGHRRAIVPAASRHQPFKLVTFVPVPQANSLRTALSEAGAGVIGHYTQCSFNVMGQGTFLGDDQSAPAVGKAGQLERVEEVRMEMAVDAGSLGRVIEALWQHHPYEEPAYDLYPLQAAPPAHRQRGAGQGRVVHLEKPASLTQVIGRIKNGLKIDHLGCVTAPQDANLDELVVSVVGVCVGAGASLLDGAGPVDLFITGEMRHHDQLAARSRGISLLLAGHSETERPYLHVLCDRLNRSSDTVTSSIPWTVSRQDQPPARRV